MKLEGLLDTSLKTIDMIQAENTTLRKDMRNLEWRLSQLERSSSNSLSSQNILD